MNKYLIKKLLLAGTGVLNRRWRSLSPGLYVFNYHRIGDSSKTAFDPNVFSCDEAHFDLQLELIASRFKVINVSQLLELIDSGKTVSEHLAMITFDDGYADNYSKAFPLLMARKLPALFFLPTNFIGTKKIPWWDEVAWLVRNTGKQTLQLPQITEPFTINQANISGSIRTVLRWFKDNSDTSLEEKLQLLRSACDCELDAQAAATLFMSWENAREMIAGGMDIGSHTKSHQILSHLSAEEQRQELAGSKEILEAATGSSINVLAYPVGGLDSYTRETVDIAHACGYRAAFNFIKGSGYNTNPAGHPFDLARIPVENQALPIDVKMSTIAAPRVN